MSKYKKHIHHKNTAINLTRKFIANLGFWPYVFILSCLIVCLIWFYSYDNNLAIKANDVIDRTPNQIEEIKNIGQWEFLSINDEELIDTTAKSIWGDKELARIYYGKLRFGINLNKTNNKWLSLKDSTIVAILPPIELLDSNFIDEMTSLPVYENGKWKSEDMQNLYDRAYHRMKKRNLTSYNIKLAESYAKEQFTRLFNNLGYQHVNIIFDTK